MSVRVLTAGLGNMGRSHALAYHRHPGFEIAGLVNRSAPPKGLDPELGGYAIHKEFLPALRELKPDAVSINTYSDSHAAFAIAALEQGAHVFIEKPLATNVKDAERVVAAARANNRKLVVGYILRHHPSWIEFIAQARKLGGPYVFRMNLNQQSSGHAWDVHKRLMETTSPIVDCGVHYVDVMCQITDAKAVEVRGMGLRLSGEIAPDMYNYGHFQVLFADGSVAWYEAAWGPMISETAFFVKDVMTPHGSVSIVMDPNAKSDDHDTHARTDLIKVHHAATSTDGIFAEADELIPTTGEPGHDALCAREQDYFYRAIIEDIDLNRHMDDAVASLRICIAADESIRSGQPVRL
jgi:predicted dehydrogenase